MEESGLLERDYIILKSRKSCYFNENVTILLGRELLSFSEVGVRHKV